MVVCPYCGGESGNASRCDRCKGLLDPLSRQASQNAMGPWFMRDEGAPFRPGCSYDTLVALVKRGKVAADSVIRGPSTRQFWTRATHVPGIAHLLGQCHSCHAGVDSGAAACPSCGASFEQAFDREYLGLAPVRLLPGHAPPEEIARAMMEEPAVRARQKVAAPVPVRAARVESDLAMPAAMPAGTTVTKARGPMSVGIGVVAVLVLALLGALATIGWLVFERLNG
jgi:hypothetical protein